MMPMTHAWAFFGLTAAALSALMMLLQERLKVEGLALAFWCKVACILVTFPFVLIYGLPSDPRFYAFLGLQSLMFAVNDVVLFRQIPIVGAGVISRLMPATLLIGFFLWFAVDPGLIDRYAAQPLVSLAILAILILATFFAMRLKRCAVSMRAVRALWFVIVANTLGPLVAKIVTGYAGPAQGPLGFTFVEAWMMIALWVLYLVIARPIPIRSLFVRSSWLGGMAVGLVMAAMIVVHVTGFYHVDNPGYITAIKLVDAVIIVGIHRIAGKNDGSDVKAGLGIVACAVALIILKAQI